MDNKINNAGEFILGLAGVIFERFDITSRPSPLSVARVTRKGFVKSSAHVLVISRRVHSLFAVDLCSFRGPQVYLTSRKLCPYAWKKTYKTNSDKENISLDKETIYVAMIDLIIFLPKRVISITPVQRHGKCEFPASEIRSGKNEVSFLSLSF